MNDEICVVCKQLVPKALAVYTSFGPAHPGPCAHYVETLPLSESTGILEETELLV
ncbi:hypothetical protein Aes012_172 [Aeromonas phage Aes012]|jgi:hypothetical protein|uniref:Uncharacterized protein n=4 Tax=Tulanevirus TaxID=2560244 RepID=E1A1D9_9CAUD|nr:hypothetical protein phiAS4_ORF0091 [Aeromonas phage phiAS4]YP_007677889.1 hypothetical protein Aes012_172 [Aeromonas phage Aes012]YP_009217583.1 hypothetical protein AVU72_gp128 [Stenotrophomonas phage IME13]YP_010095964.1 hypothetical protein KNT91_gp236 [Aeromonas phage 60AhydR15PP]ADM79663.1 hypothetical protein phiAS4_ORF0091 [Aeromonas phage phiAS4]AFN69802.1 hypothetical protein Aes012_172 [Aeromonas phage Aes012]AFQ22663.1 hypothetical protein [Stenotrophomonas phage IME13]AWH1576